jgi:hypothetical protein
MKTVCALCRKVVIENGAPSSTVSHWICTDCMKRLFGQSEVKLKDILNAMDFPVLVTDESVTLLQLNQNAERRLAGSVQALELPTIDIAIECRRPGNQEMCDGGADCAGCVLRQTLCDTSVDGRPRVGIYSDREVVAGDGTKANRCRFSATKIGDAVVLAIEGVGNIAIEARPGNGDDSEDRWPSRHR